MAGATLPAAGGGIGIPLSGCDAVKSISGGLSRVFMWEMGKAVLG